MWGNLLKVSSLLVLSGAVSGCVVTLPFEIAYAVQNRPRYCVTESGALYARHTDCAAADKEIESGEYQRLYANKVADQTQQKIAANEAARNAKTYCLAGLSQTPYIAASGQCQPGDTTISEPDYRDRKAGQAAILGARATTAISADSVVAEPTAPQTATPTPSKPTAAAVKPALPPKATGPALDPIPGPTVAKPIASGTAFFIADKGHVLTNFHVVEGCHWIGLVADGEIHPAVTLARDQDLDLAILKTDFAGGVAVFADQQPDIGDDSYVAGYPLLSTLWSLNFTNGIISSQAPLGESSLLQTTAPVQRGNSGGPMFDGSGHVVGIVVARLKDDSAENVNFAIKSEVATSFIRQSGIDPKIAARGKDLKASVIAKRARSMVVPAICFKQMGSPGTID